MYVLYLYLAACGPKGHGSGKPLPSRTAALFYSPLTRPNPIPNYSELYWGIPVIYTIYPPDKRKVVKRTKEKDKGKYILGRTWPVLLTLLHLLPVPVFVHSSPSRRHPAPYPRVLQKTHHCPYGLLFPQPPQSQRPWVLSFASLPSPLPQGLDLRNPSPTLSEQMMARLPLPSVAPLALVHIQTWAGYLVVKEGPDRRVTREQLVIPLGRGLADPPQCSPSEAGAARGRYRRSGRTWSLIHCEVAAVLRSVVLLVRCGRLVCHRTGLAHRLSVLRPPP